MVNATAHDYKESGRLREMIITCLFTLHSVDFQVTIYPYKG